jgi:hypothetical protein
MGQSSMDNPDTFNPAPLENDETIRKWMVKFVSTASSNDDISFRKKYGFGWLYRDFLACVHICSLRNKS